MLYVANADNNCIVVVDIEEENESQVKGMIPTGWYPTSVAITPDGKSLLVGVGKGNQTKANPIPPEQAPQDKNAIERRGLPFPYIGTTLSGALSIIAMPSDEELAAYTERVYKNCPYSDKLLAGTPSELKTAMPTKIGDPSPIKHVIYIIKENRTYDQVFGDIAGSNADPNAGDVRRGDHSQPSQAGQGICAARQLVLQWAGLARRTSLVDHGL